MQTELSDAADAQPGYNLCEIRGSVDELAAYAMVPGGSIIRLVGYDYGHKWTEAVEIGEPGAWATVHEGQGLSPTQEYNRLVEELGADGGV